MINAVLLQPLPYPEPQNLLTVWETNTHSPDEPEIVSAPNFLDWQRQNDVFERMAAYEQQNYNLAGQSEPEQVKGMRVTTSLFPLLRMQPYLGRSLVPVLAGVGIGVAGALALTRILTSLLFQVSASDPATFAMVALLLLSVAALASLVAALKAASVNPVIALRHE